MRSSSKQQLNSKSSRFFLAWMIGAVFFQVVNLLVNKPINFIDACFLVVSIAICIYEYRRVSKEGRNQIIGYSVIFWTGLFVTVLGLESFLLLLFGLSVQFYGLYQLYYLVGKERDV